jgi:putative ATP:guanido phosphotransferase hore_00860
MNENMLDSVISTRVRLARNLKGMPFPSKLGAGQAGVISGKVYGAMGDGCKLYNIAGLNEAEAGALVEKHLISKELVSSCPYGSVIVGDDETVSVMLNEEDHVREQVIMSGLKLDEAYRYVDGLDDRIAEAAEFAYSDRLGYLTACPTNLGTGMRASVMMFLPALTLTDTLIESVNALGMLNIALRGVYGEGSDAAGFIYQISNRRTLGLSEKDILGLVNSAAEHLAEAEQRAREFLIATREITIKDEIMRAYGVASNAYVLTNQEMIRCCAFIKLGAYYKLIAVKRVAALDELMTSLQPFSLISAADRPLLTPEERDAYRAECVRSSLKEIASV